MKVTIDRGVEKGHKFLTGGGCSTSRELTGTTGETGAGIFEGTTTIVEFNYGTARRAFLFNEKIDLYNDSASEIKRKLKERIRQVREWVNSIDYRETIEFEID